MKNKTVTRSDVGRRRRERWKAERQPEITSEVESDEDLEDRGIQ